MQLAIIQQKIYEIREYKVMLDFDLADLYDIETKRLKEAVKRNMKRFPPDFMFQLTKAEFHSLRSQFATSNRGGTRYMPFAFTEHGVTMLASILHSDKAIDMNIAIVRAFTSLRKLVSEGGDIAAQLLELRQELFEKIGEHDVQLAGIYDAIENLLDEKSEQKSWVNRKRIGFKSDTD
jgi:phage regulator Rha-like protein